MGAYRAEEMVECAGWARAFAPLTSAEMDALRARGRGTAPEWGLGRAGG